MLTLSPARKMGMKKPPVERSNGEANDKMRGLENISEECTVKKHTPKNMRFHTDLPQPVRQILQLKATHSNGTTL